MIYKTIYNDFQEIGKRIFDSSIKVADIDYREINERVEAYPASESLRVNMSSGLLSACISVATIYFSQKILKS